MFIQLLYVFKNSLTTTSSSVLLGKNYKSWHNGICIRYSAVYILFAAVSTSANER